MHYRFASDINGRGILPSKGLTVGNHQNHNILELPISLHRSTGHESSIRFHYHTILIYPFSRRYCHFKKSISCSPDVDKRFYTFSKIWENVWNSKKCVAKYITLQSYRNNAVIVQLIVLKCTDRM